MRKKILTAVILVIVFAFGVNAFAASQNNTGNGNQNQEQTQTANQGEDDQAQVQNNNPDATLNGDEDETDGNETDGDETDEELPGKNQNGQINAEQHRSTVANFVQDLLQVADRAGGIGEQVRTIAQEQNQSEDTTIQAMEEVQTRSKIKTFFFGSDYKNLGTLRSEMVQTRNRLEQLERVAENVQNEGDETELQSQIQTLEQEQTKIENFIKAQEEKFSLFGWLVNWFVKLFS